MQAVTIHTDGACRGNPGPGGWGAVLQCGDKTREIYGGVAATTNNRMEMTAVIEALQALKVPCKVMIKTDSVYVLKGFTEWMPAWKQRGWRTSAKKPVLNVDLWQTLEQAASKHEIEWQWVKGHSGDAGNERADQLANRGIDELPG